MRLRRILPRTAAVMGMLMVAAPLMLGGSPAFPEERRIQGLSFPPAGDPWTVCRAAVRQAERQWRIPPNLLAAIARVESGRRNPANGQTTPWPWTINAEGQGFYFDTKQEAIRTAEQLLARGVRSFDVGCMQINLRHHPDAFLNLADAFDPLTNSQYGARYLVELYEMRRNWTHAAMAYHSSTPELAEAYQNRLMAALPLEAVETQPQLPAALQGPRQPPSPDAMEDTQKGPSLSPLRTPARILRSTQGPPRDLASYRSQPIPLTGRRLPSNLPVVQRPSSN